MRKGILGIAALGFCFCLGAVLSILACALPGENWWPMFELVFILLAPIPVVVGGALSRGAGTTDVFFKTQPKNTFFLDLGLFLSTALLFSGFAFPVVLAHAGVISYLSLTLTVCGSIIIYASLGGYVFFYIINKKKEPEMI